MLDSGLRIGGAISPTVHNQLVRYEDKYWYDNHGVRSFSTLI